MLIKYKIKYIFLSILIILFDLISKNWIVNNISQNTSIFLNNFISITHIKNYGIAFGLLSEMGKKQNFLLIFFLTTLTILLFLINFFYKNKLISEVSYSLITGGALGNLLDRIYHGTVVDFIDLHIGYLQFPIFNFADISIFFALIITLIKNMFLKHKIELFSIQKK